MSLKIQIETIIFSYFIGTLAFFIRKIFTKQIYHKKFLIKFLFSFFYIELLTIIYVVGLYKINNFTLHFYSYFFLILGFFLNYTYCK